jgi:hypothetical protein
MGAETRANALRAVAIAVVLVALFVFFFVFPGHDPEPNHVPIGVVGPEGPFAPLAAGLERGGDFDVKRYGGAEEARSAILDREVYGALLVEPRSRLLIASAASPQVASILEELAAGGALGRPAPAIEDLRTLGPNDPAGTTISLTMLPLAITSILGAMLMVLLAPGLGGGERFLLLAAFALLGAGSAVLITNVALDALPGPFLGLAAIAALAILAIATPSAGNIGLLGPPGILASFLIFLMLGNPASGAASAPARLPDPWREAGQFLPPGAAGTAFRNVAYFDGAALAKPLIVLAAWVLIGVLLLAVVARRGAVPPSGAVGSR